MQHMTTSLGALKSRRQQTETLRAASPTPTSRSIPVHEGISSSWQRSSLLVPTERRTAPLVASSSSWQQSAYGHAIMACEAELKSLVKDSGMVAAVADNGGKILWTDCSKPMQSNAERVHFVPDSLWDEGSVGTNALALALRSKHSVCVYSSEHFMPSVQDWVCYAAPIIDRGTGQTLGVIDLSTTWDKHSALGVLAAERLADRISTVLGELQKHQLQLKMLGTTQVLLNGKKIPLSPRQIEILCVLALCPEGLNLDSLHHALYGDRPISVGTLKTEISQLREAIGGAIGSRPYRFLVDVSADFLELENALDAGYVEAALRGYHGVFLARSESPLLLAWRYSIESRLSDIIFHATDTDLLLRYFGKTPEAIDALQRLTELLPADHPAQGLLGKVQLLGD
jgi:hypothetical protein